MNNLVLLIGSNQFGRLRIEKSRNFILDHRGFYTFYVVVSVNDKFLGTMSFSSGS